MVGIKQKEIHILPKVLVENQHQKKLILIKLPEKNHLQHDPFRRLEQDCQTTQRNRFSVFVILY